MSENGPDFPKIEKKSKTNILKRIRREEKYKSNWTISLGLNDRLTFKQEVSTDKVMHEICKTFPDGCTVIPCIGVYKGVMEPSLKIECYGYDHDTMTAKATHLMTWLNQECIIVTDLKTQESDFLGLDDLGKKGA